MLNNIIKSFHLYIFRGDPISIPFKKNILIPNPFVLSILFISGAIMYAYGLTGYDTRKIIDILLAYTAFSFLLYGALMLNDVSDRQIDIIAHPERPLPSGKIDVTSLVVASCISFTIAIGISYFINIQCFYVALAEFVLCAVHYGYTKKNLKLKGTSEAITALQCAVIPIYCMMVAQNSDIAQIMLITLFIFISDVSHDIAGGINDKEGDTKYNVMTFAVCYGDKFAARACLVTLLIAIFIGFLMWRFTVLGTIFVTILVVVSMITIKDHIKLIKDPIPENGAASYMSGLQFYQVVFSAMALDIGVRLLLTKMNLNSASLLCTWLK